MQSAVDGFYGAAILAAAQAAFGPQVTLDQLQIPGILGWVGWPDHAAYLQASDLVSLGESGFATANIKQNAPGALVVDNITAGAYSLDGVSINPFYQTSIRKQDDLVSKTAVGAAQAFGEHPRRVPRQWPRTSPMRLMRR